MRDILDAVSTIKEKSSDQTTDNDASKYTTDNPTNPRRFGKTRRGRNGLHNWTLQLESRVLTTEGTLFVVPLADPCKHQ